MLLNLNFGCDAKPSKYVKAFIGFGQEDVG